MIVKNEEKNLGKCLDSVSEIVDEIIIVDTGSTDNTIEIAVERGAKLFSFQWDYNFSSARNFALEKCSCEWILYLDADECLSEESSKEILHIKSGSPNKAYFCKILNEDYENDRPSVMIYPRIFPNKQDIRFQGSVHEQIEQSLKEHNIPIYYSNILIRHYGYNISKEQKKRKAERNLAILLKDYDFHSDSYTAFQIAQSYGILQDQNSAEKYFLFSLSDKSLRNEYQALAYRYLGLNLADRNELGPAKKLLHLSLKKDHKQPLTLLAFFEIEKKSHNFHKALIYLTKAHLINTELLQGLSNSFQSICVNEEVFFVAAIEFSLLSKTTEALDHFYQFTSGKYKLIFPLIKTLVNDKIYPSELDTAVTEHFFNSPLPVLLGKYFKETDNPKGTEYYFSIAINNGLADPSAYLYIIAASLNNGRNEEALTYAQRGYNLNKDTQFSFVFKNIIDRIKSIR